MGEGNRLYLVRNGIFRKILGYVVLERMCFSSVLFPLGWEEFSPPAQREKFTSPDIQIELRPGSGNG